MGIPFLYQGQIPHLPHWSQLSPDPLVWEHLTGLVIWVSGRFTFLFFIYWPVSADPMWLYFRGPVESFSISSEQQILPDNQCKAGNACGVSSGGISQLVSLPSGQLLDHILSVRPRVCLHSLISPSDINMPSTSGPQKVSLQWPALTFLLKSQQKGLRKRIGSLVQTSLCLHIPGILNCHSRPHPAFKIHLKFSFVLLAYIHRCFLLLFLLCYHAWSQPWVPFS